MTTNYELKAKNLIGTKFGNRTVIDITYKVRGTSQDKKRSEWYFICKCENGHQSCIRKCELIESECIGCYIPHNKKSDMQGTSIYNIWKAMRQRCMNQKCKDYKYYGGRGIKICTRWDLFINFYEDMGDKPQGKSLDRIDNNGDYTPFNCKWSTQKEQVNNSRTVMKE